MKTIARFQKHPAWMFFRLMMVLQVLVMFCEPALALPRGENVKHGEVKFKQDGDYLKIKQKSGKAIVEYNSFDIDRPETVEFVQPSKGSAILNRVVGGGASEIAGKLLANGMVYLINTNGILFTSSARVNVGALIASAMNMSDGDFLSGRMFFSGGNGTVTNKGSISGRSVYLVGGKVKNKGRISAREVVLGAGRDSVLIDTIAGGEIRLVIDGEEQDADSAEDEADAEDSEEVTDGEEASTEDQENEEDAEGDAGDSSSDEGNTSSDTEDVVDVDEEVEEVLEEVNHELGQIVNKGEIVLKGKKGGNIVIGGTQVKQMGDITADGVKAGGGTIKISAEEKVTIAEDSVTSAKALKSGVGGVIVIEGEDILLETGSLIDASGIDGGGIIRIGGGFQGNNTNIKNAENTYVEEGAEIKADAIESGDGGSVVVWSDDTTEFYGKISAQALGKNGDGGFAEVSGKNSLKYGGLADLRSVNGDSGLLLLDPTDIDIPTDIAVTTIYAQLALGDMAIYTRSADVTDSGDITINADIGITAAANGHAFSLLATRHVEFNNSVQIDGTCDLNIVAGWDESTGFAATHSGTPFYTNALFDMSAILADSGSYGNNNGSVNIGDGTQVVGIAVGSKDGDTNVAAYDLALIAGGFQSFAHLGYFSSTVADISGDINIVVSNNVTAIANGYRAYVHIGHGGPHAFASASNINSDITITAVGMVTFQAGGANNSAYALLGHGGFDYDADITGNISLQAEGNILFTGSSTDGSYAQIGHNGQYLGDGDYVGDIMVSGANFQFTAGSGSNSYAQIGHGGNRFGVTDTSTLSGDITITANSLNFQGSSGQYTYAQIGHGGYNADGAKSGNITVYSGGDISFTGGTDTAAYVQIGHGGVVTDGTCSGLISVRGRDIMFTTITGNTACAQIGHGGAWADGSRMGDISVTGRNITFQTGNNWSNYAQIGHGGTVSGGTDRGLISLRVIILRSRQREEERTHMFRSGTVVLSQRVIEQVISL